MIKIKSLTSILMYSLLFVCIFTSIHWSYDSLSARGEIFRFDKILLFRNINIYYLFSGVFLILYLIIKYNPNKEPNGVKEKNFLKYIFWLYFIPVVILQYAAIYLKDIHPKDLGIHTVARFFVYLIVVYYVQNVFLKDNNLERLNTSLTILEGLILLRAFYSILKFMAGFGPTNKMVGGIRLAQETDFHDFFCLLFVIALTRLLFRTGEKQSLKILHILGIVTSSFIAIFSYRRNFILEILVALVMLYYFRFRKTNKGHDNLYVSGILVFLGFILSLVLLMGPDRIGKNYYLGRVISSLSLIDDKYASAYGNEMGHRAEIEDGWANVKKNYILGITPYGKNKMVRGQTRQWQEGVWVHNAYLFVWLEYGILGLVLFMGLYIKSLELGYTIYHKLNNEAGLILIAFMTCQIIKNIVWPTVIEQMNVTIIYIFIISILMKIKSLSPVHNTIKT